MRECKRARRFSMPGITDQDQADTPWSKILRICSSPAILSRSTSSMTSKAVGSGEALATRIAPRGPPDARERFRFLQLANRRRAVI